MNARKFKRSNMNGVMDARMTLRRLFTKGPSYAKYPNHEVVKALITSNLAYLDGKTLALTVSGKIAARRKYPYDTEFKSEEKDT